MTLPIAQLAVESLQTNPPRPIGYHVIVDGQTVAILMPETVEQAHAEYQTLLATCGTKEP